MSITLKTLFFLIGLLLTSTTAWGFPNFADPAIPLHTKLVYQIEEAKNKFEYIVYTNSINTAEGEAYQVLTSILLGTFEGERTQTIYTKKPFLPLSYIESYQNKDHGIHYYKAIAWDWAAQKYSFEEICQEGSKNSHKGATINWKDNPSLELSLIYTGLLNGLPLDEQTKQTRFKLSVDKFSVDVNFKIVTREVISATGRNWECYKIEANPDLGILLNWVKILLGDPKSYVWLTTSKPKLIIKTFINLPWAKRKVQLVGRF